MISQDTCGLEFRGIRAAGVCKMFDASRTTIWRWSKTNHGFPKPIKLSSGVTVWNKDELTAWIDARKAERAE